ncbi:hypothetical protein JOD24_002083 [Kroppenstedtia sanguinis]
MRMLTLCFVLCVMNGWKKLVQIRCVTFVKIGRRNPLKFDAEAPWKTRGAFLLKP